MRLRSLRCKIYSFSLLQVFVILKMTDICFLIPLRLLKLIVKNNNDKLYFKKNIIKEFDEKSRKWDNNNLNILRIFLQLRKCGILLRLTYETCC